MIKIFKQDNMTFNLYEKTGIRFTDYIYGDCIYESEDFSWVDKYWSVLADKGIFVIQTDYHTQHLYRYYMEKVVGAYFVNHIVHKNEWGKPPSKNFHQCYDDILIYSKSKTWRFNRDKIQVPKATAKSKGLNPSGRVTKTATCWVDDITLTTSSSERIKKSDGHLIRWQKPKKLMERISLPFLLKGELVLDVFMGSGTLGEVCGEQGWDYVGLEVDKEPFDLAKNRLKKYLNDREHIPF